MAPTYYIKKNGKFLAKPKPVYEEAEYDDYSVISGSATVEFEWIDDQDDALAFHLLKDAEWYMAAKRGAFWRGAEGLCCIKIF